MAKLTEDQQEFWDILSKSYPKIRDCDTCKYGRKYNGGMGCLEPEYVRTQGITNCGVSYNFVHWKWSGDFEEEID